MSQSGSSTAIPAPQASSELVPDQPGAPLDGQRAAGSGSMFDGIAPRYDLLNRLASLGMDQGWRRALVNSLQDLEPTRILDVATGTADVALALALAYPQARVEGLDPSANMLSLGNEKVGTSPYAERVTLLQGDAQGMPFPADSFDAAVISFGIRNVPDRLQGLKEMVRVVRPGGKVAVLELNTPKRGLLAPFARFHCNVVVPALGAWLSGSREYRYLAKSMAAFPEAPEFAALMEQAGLSEVTTRPMGFYATNLFVGRVPAQSE